MTGCVKKMYCKPTKKMCVPTDPYRKCNPTEKNVSLPLKKVMSLSLKQIIDKLTGKA